MTQIHTRQLCQTFFAFQAPYLTYLNKRSRLKERLITNATQLYVHTGIGMIDVIGNLCSSDHF